MINLKNYIIESILDIEDNINNMDESIKEEINQFLNDNFDGASLCKISDKPNNDGKYEVSSKEIIKVKNKKITSLTNGLFIWTTVDKDFKCAFCDLLTSLEGAPKNVKGTFDCSYCDSLKSLEGAPKEISKVFDCSHCNSLKSLEGAPRKVGGTFYCSNCQSLKSLKGAPEKVGGTFDCSYCQSLISLEGAPKEVGRNFSCDKCKVKFTEDDVKKISNVKGEIIN